MSPQQPRETADDFELSLSLPGTKRGFSDTVDLLHLATSSADNDQFSSSSSKPPPHKAQVVGWPPVRANRKNALKSSSKYVKVGVDGAPYLRKVDLEMYDSYDHLLKALEDMFTCLTIRNDLNKRKLMDPGNGTEYMPTYEDKDADWMLLGDVPWKMFVESCKRIRLMIKSEALGLAPRTATKSRGSSS